MCAPLVLIGLAGCPSGGNGGAAGQPSAEDCTKAGQGAGDYQGTTALVVDNTASAVATGLPPAITEVLARAQQDRHRLALVPVRGAGERAAVARFVPLNPRPDDDSQAGDAARRIVLDCVEQWAHAADMLPAAPGSAPIDALAAASREDPATIAVLSDGLSNAGDFDLDDVGFDADPAAVAAKLRAAGSLPDTLAGRTVVWAGLGDSTKPLRQALRTSLRQLWQQVLGSAKAKVTFDDRAAEPVGAPAGLPADDVKLPDAAKAVWACGDSYTIPAAMLFAPDSADLGDRSDAVLRQVADALAGHPDWVAEIGGHTADFGTAAGRQRLSESRARTVARALAELGVDESRLTAAGYGATRPAADEWTGGGHDLAAAARNRRVVVHLGVRGCHA
ncbi:OmpA family protein [Actinoplanes sp. RD1]|uniref:OmpA family protein n=1 Tax=Actinoplanes sp. RD1 TaxID=3064538 RepID=UPI002740A691|nr:OmpA family protein [Actinoplanes sp. RD1]